jgi:hypothetical protein
MLWGLFGATLGLAGCWDFGALQQGGDPLDLTGVTDLASPGDMVCRGNDNLREDCTNGGDDDGDCLADCLDPDCMGGPLCQPITGLVGYGRPASACAMGERAAFMTPLYDALDMSKPPCANCTCGAPTACATRLRLHASMDCTDTPISIPLPGAMECIGVSGMASLQRYYLDNITLACAPSTGIKAEPITKNSTQLCLAAGAIPGCTTAACVLSQRASCIALSGAGQACPAPFVNGSTWYQKYTDSRTCACTCTTPAGKVCDNDVAMNKKADCTGMGMERRDIAEAGKCLPFPGMFQAADLKAVQYRLKPAAGAACTAGGTPMGQMPALSDPVTLCCTP